MHRRELCWALYESLDDLSHKKVHAANKLIIKAEERLVENKMLNETYKIQPMGSVADIVEAGRIFEFAPKENMIACQ